MKVLPFIIPKPENNALIYQVDRGDQFYNQLHQHQEIQISMILEGEGDLVVGDTVNRYQKDAIILIGANVPHLFRSDTTITSDSHMLTFFFSKDSFGKFFFDLIEMRELKSIFNRIDSGIQLEDRIDEVKEMFLGLEKESHLERFISFLKILKLISKAKTKSLSSFIYSKMYSDNEGERMSNVMNHAISNFNRELTLSEIADIANMTPNAFCRYFKQRTNKTFFQFLLEIRLEHACRLLVKGDTKNISDVSYATGFRNISNFNRKFRAIKGTTPTAYRKSIIRN